MTTTTKRLAKGDRTTVEVLRGYKLVQDRPRDCRYSCTCGTCNGTTTVYEGAVQRVIYWADNSIDAEVLCDDGEVRTKQLMFPHGDACF